MANYSQTRSKNKFLTGLAVILALLLVASVTLGLGAHFGGWFDDTVDDTDTETSSVEEIDSVEDSSSELEVS